jgi:hypothetical protein
MYVRSTGTNAGAWKIKYYGYIRTWLNLTCSERIKIVARQLYDHVDVLTDFSSGRECYKGEQSVKVLEHVGTSTKTIQGSI